MENKEVRNIKTMRIKNLDKFIEKNKLEEILPNNFCCVFENLGKVLNIDTVAIIDRIYFSRKEYEEKKDAIYNNRYLEILEVSDNYVINFNSNNKNTYINIYFEKKEFIKNYFLGKYKIISNNNEIEKILLELELHTKLSKIEFKNLYLYKKRF